jgi:predicted Na+-dependent transporter
MIKSNRLRLKPRTRAVIVLLLVSFILLPLIVYVVGRIVVGDYEGSSGLLGFVGSIYADAARGRWVAWALLGSPALCVATWAIVWRIRRRPRQPA